MDPRSDPAYSETQRRGENIKSPAYMTVEQVMLSTAQTWDIETREPLITCTNFQNCFKSRL